jgi:hypothetical protein
MTTLIAFAIPFVTLAFMGGLAYGVVVKNRRAGRAQQKAYYIETTQVRYHLGDKAFP